MVLGAGEPPHPPGFRLEEAVTFGAPKFTDLDGSAEVLRRRVPLLRVNNRADPVPRLPPWPQYIQAGAEVFRQGGERRKVQYFF